jgi:hypothetical protein
LVVHFRLEASGETPQSRQQGGKIEDGLAIRAYPSAAFPHGDKQASRPAIFVLHACFSVVADEAIAIDTTLTRESTIAILFRKDNFLPSGHQLARLCRRRERNPPRTTCHKPLPRRADSGGRDVLGMVAAVKTQQSEIDAPLDDLVVNGRLSDGTSTRLDLQVTTTLSFTESYDNWTDIVL